MTFIPAFSLTGQIPVLNYAVAGSEEWDVYDILALDAAAALLEPSGDNADILGAAGASVGNTTVGQSDADELRPYLSALLTGKHEPCIIMTYATVFLTDNPSGTANSAATTDIGTVNDLDLSGGEWGILLGTSVTAATPNFKTIDIERTRGLFLVVAEPTSPVDVFQFFDAAV